MSPVRRLSFAALLLALALPCSLFAQRLVYRATFSNDSGEAQAIQSYGWTILEGGGPLTSAVVEPAVSRRTRDEFNAPTPHGISLPEGVLALTASAVPRSVFLSTGAHAIGVLVFCRINNYTYNKRRALLRGWGQKHECN